ncbi:MAG: hypothetical protein RJA07_1585 [Bacteroidota bacterium]|jgi:predicted nucleic acid-binding protein
MKYLIDTNIFLEILLNQNNAEKCSSFLSENVGEWAVSDFAIHSIGLKLFNTKIDLKSTFIQFINDINLHSKILSSISSENFDFILKGINQNLDYDDAYQLLIAELHDLTIVTLDNDFKKVNNQNRILFINK